MTSRKLANFVLCLFFMVGCATPAATPTSSMQLSHLSHTAASDTPTATPPPSQTATISPSPTITLSPKPSPTFTPAPQIIVLQEGNFLIQEPAEIKPADQLENNGVGKTMGSAFKMFPEPLRGAYTWVQFAGDSNNAKDLTWQSVEYEPGKYWIESKYENYFYPYIKARMETILILSVGSGENRPDMTRFRSQDEIDHYLGFVRFVVEHFKGRIRYYEIWSEENLIPPHAKWGGIRLEDYINLLEQVAPVIHAIDPEARVIAGSVGALWLPGYPNYGTFVRPYFDEKYLRGLVSSDVMPLIDGISMHIFYGLRPDDPFYRNYPRFVAEIKSLAYAHGFKGEFFSQEVTYRTGQEGFDMDLFPFPHVIAGKYLARVILIHRGLDIIVTVANDTSQFRAAFGRGKSSETSLALLNTLLDQAAPVSLPVEVKSDTDVEYLAHYAFRYPDERLLVGIWNDGLAVEEDPGITADLVFPGITAQRVQAYDLLYCLKQELHYENRLGGLVLPGIKLRDYPLLLEISPE